MKKKVDEDTRMIPFRIKFGGRYIVNSFTKVPKDYDRGTARNDRKEIQSCSPVTKVEIWDQEPEEQSTITQDFMSNRHSSALKKVQDRPVFKKPQTPTTPRKSVLWSAKSQLQRPKPRERKKIKSHKSTTRVPSESANCGDNGVAAVYRKIGVGLMDALSRVADEVHDNIRDEVLRYNPNSVAVAVQKQMFALIARPANRANNAKLRSIMFNMKDPSNPDLRRKVLLGEINPARLLTMTAEEMASDQRRNENEQIRQKSLNKNRQ